MRSGAIVALCIVIGLAVPVFADDYNKDLKQAFDAIEKATWLSKDEYVQYVRSFHEYEKERSDCLSGLIKIVALPDKDVASGWMSTRGLGAVALGKLKDTVPKLEKLGLKEWTDRETLMYEKLKAEQFLRARQDLITSKETSIQAAKMLDDKWKDFDEKNQAINSELVEKENAFKDKLTGWAKVVGEAAGQFSSAIGSSSELGKILKLIGILGKNAKELRPVLEAAHMKMQAKKPNWEYLNKLNELQQQIWEQIEPGKIERKFSEAKLDDVSGSEDFKNFTAAAIEAMKVHRQAALMADEEYRKVVTGKFADRSSSTIENIKQLDALGKKWKESEDIEKSAEDSLKSIEDSISKMRDGPEKDEATAGLKEAREGLKDLIEDQKKDLEEYKSEADKVKN